MRLRSTAGQLALFMLVPAVAAGVTSGPGVPDDGWGLDAWYSAYEIVPMDPAATVADAEDGEVTLRLDGRTIVAEVAPAPWDARLALGRLDAEGGVTIVTPDFPTYAFLGTVKGVADSRVLLAVSEAGVGGLVRVADDEVHFDPVATEIPGAPFGVSFAYRPADVIMSGIGHAHSLDTSPPLAPDAEEPVRVQSHEPGPDRRLTLWASKSLHDWSPTAWSSRVWTAYNRMNSGYDAEAGFSFTVVNNLVYYCDTKSCDDYWYLSNGDSLTIIKEWAKRVRDWGTVSSFELAAASTGHDLDGGGVLGRAWQPGRYAVTDSLSQSAYEYSLTLAHETGHNLNGDHGNRGIPTPGRALRYAHEHVTGTYNHCHWRVTVPILGYGYCVENHEHQQTKTYYHHTLMYGGVTHGSGVNEQFFELSNTGDQNNYYWVRSCNYNDFTEGNKEPGNAGMGYYCQN